MESSSAVSSGILGAIVFVLAIGVVYVLVARKSSWDLLSKNGITIPENWREGRYGAWLLALAGAAIFYWDLYTPGLRFSEVGSWSWKHWLWLLAFGGIIFALIKVCEKQLGTLAGTLQTTLVVALFLMFLGIPAGLWVRDGFLPTIICPDVSAYQTRSCLLNTAWSSWIKIADGPAANGMQVCATPGGESERIQRNGTTFWRFRADEGRLKKTYRLFPPTQECPATLS